MERFGKDGPDTASTIAAAVAACVVLIAASALLRIAASYLVSDTYGPIVATGLAIGVAWIGCDLLVWAYRPLPVRLSVVALGVIWLAWNVWKISMLGVTDHLLGESFSAAVLLIAPWQTLKGGDREADLGRQ